MFARSWKHDFFGYIHYWKRILSSYGYHNKSMDVWENFMETGFGHIKKRILWSYGNQAMDVWENLETFFLMCLKIILSSLVTNQWMCGRTWKQVF